MTMAACGTRALSRMHASSCSCVVAYPRELRGERQVAVSTNAESVRSYPAGFRLDFLEL
jgi:hypothetical protein